MIKSAWSITAAGRFGKLAANESWLTDRLSAYLARRVDNFSRKVLPSVSDDLTESVFDGGVVAIYKVTIDKLHREGRFPWEGWAIRLDRWRHAPTSNGLARGSLPTDRLPTTAIFRCLDDAGMAMISDRLGRRRGNGNGALWQVGHGKWSGGKLG